MIIKRHELPIAYLMIDAASRVKPRRDGRHPFDKFFLLWTAFSHIYRAIAQQKGVHTQLVEREDGSIETYANGHVKISKVIPVSENQQLSLAVQAMDDRLKHALIEHESTLFFLNRIPYWQGKPIEHDAFGQRVNGIINIAFTSRPDYPVWSPLDPQVYQTYLANPDRIQDRDFLAGQIVELLYTLSTNIMHISRDFDDGNDISVAQHALPLLEMIISSFTR